MRTKSLWDVEYEVIPLHGEVTRTRRRLVLPEESTASTVQKVIANHELGPGVDRVEFYGIVKVGDVDEPLLIGES